jgi:hypothetical protein
VLTDQQSKPKIELVEVSGQTVEEKEAFDLWRIKCYLEPDDVPTNEEIIKAAALVMSRKPDKSQRPTPREIADAIKEIFSNSRRR